MEIFLSQCDLWSDLETSCKIFLVEVGFFGSVEVGVGCMGTCWKG